MKKVYRKIDLSDTPYRGTASLKGSKPRDGFAEFIQRPRRSSKMLSET